jgi:hypothetical protein
VAWDLVKHKENFGFTFTVNLILCVVCFMKIGIGCTLKTTENVLL